MNFANILKLSKTTGPIGLSFAMLAFIYFHERGYTDATAWEDAGAVLVLAMIAHLVPSSVDTQALADLQKANAPQNTINNPTKETPRHEM